MKKGNKIKVTSKRSQHYKKEGIVDYIEEGYIFVDFGDSPYRTPFTKLELELIEEKTVNLSELKLEFSTEDILKSISNQLKLIEFSSDYEESQEANDAENAIVAAIEEKFNYSFEEETGHNESFDVLKATQKERLEYYRSTLIPELLGVNMSDDYDKGQEEKPKEIANLFNSDEYSIIRSCLEERKENLQCYLDSGKWSPKYKQEFKDELIKVNSILSKIQAL